MADITVGNIRETIKDLPDDVSFGFIDYFGDFEPHDVELEVAIIRGSKRLGISYIDLPSSS